MRRGTKVNRALNEGLQLHIRGQPQPHVDGHAADVTYWRDVLLTRRFKCRLGQPESTEVEEICQNQEFLYISIQEQEWHRSFNVIPRVNTDGKGDSSQGEI